MMKWILLLLVLLFVWSAVSADIQRGQAGYDSFYYRHYTPYTSPFSFTASLAQVRNLPIGQRVWVRSGFGCEYLVEHVYDSKWRHHLGVVHDMKSRWGLPCHEAVWWSRGSIIADGGPDDCPSGIWIARREAYGGGGRVVWTCSPSVRSLL